MKKVSTLTPRDKYLRKNFNRTEEEYNRAFKEQDGVCYICHEPPMSRSHHVDHDHKVEKLKIKSIKSGKKWTAWPSEMPEAPDAKRLLFVEEAKTKPEALAKVRRKLLRLSTRGILCWQCNRAIAKFKDDPDRLSRACLYLLHYKSFLEGLSEKGPAFYE